MKTNEEEGDDSQRYRVCVQEGRRGMEVADGEEKRGFRGRQKGQTFIFPKIKKNKE